MTSGVNEHTLDTPLIRSVPAAPDAPRLLPPRRAVIWAFQVLFISVGGLIASHLCIEIAPLRPVALLALEVFAIVTPISIVATAVTWIAWQLRAAANAHQMSRDPLGYSPIFGLVLFLLPVVNLVFAVRVLTEIWNASHLRPPRAPSPGLLRLWWLVAVLSPPAVFVFGGSLPKGFLFLIHFAAALVSVEVVRRINAGQERARAALRRRD